MFFEEERQTGFKGLLSRMRLYFVPHEQNDFVPKVAQHKLLFGYSFVLLALKLVSLLLLIFLPAASLYSSAITRTNILALTNAARANTGITDLTLNGELNQAAQAKANDMVSEQYFAHTSPAGLTPWHWIRGSGYEYQLAGENLAVHYAQSEEVQSAWMASPSHRANILNARFEEVGIGIASGTFEDFETMFVVQMFGQPKEVVAPTVATDTAPVEKAATLEAPVDMPESTLVALAPLVAGEITEPDVASPIESVSIQPTEEKDVYNVRLAVKDAEQANIVREGIVTKLELTKEGEFSGTIRSESAMRGDGLVIASVLMGDGSYITEPIALFSEDTDAAEFYAFAPVDHVKLFKFIEVKIVQDGIALVYVAAVIFICGLLLLTVLVRFEHQRHSVNAHLLVVLLLAAILFVL